MTSKRGFVVNYVLLEHTGRGCPVKAQADLHLNEVPQTKAQKDIIVPEFLSLVASVQQEAGLSLGAGAGSLLRLVTACPALRQGAHPNVMECITATLQSQPPRK